MIGYSDSSMTRSAAREAGTVSMPLTFLAEAEHGQAETSKAAHRSNRHLYRTLPGWRHYPQSMEPHCPKPTCR